MSFSAVAGSSVSVSVFGPGSVSAVRCEFNVVSHSPGMATGHVAVSVAGAVDPSCGDWLYGERKEPVDVSCSGSLTTVY